MPPIWFTRFCYHSDRYQRELQYLSIPPPLPPPLPQSTKTSFRGSPIRVLVNNAPNDPVIPYFVHASILCRFSGWFRSNFEEYERQKREAKANGTDLGPDAWHALTLRISDCDPEVFELYLNWQYTERFPIPITLYGKEDYDNRYVYSYDDDDDDEEMEDEEEDEDEYEDEDEEGEEEEEDEDEYEDEDEEGEEEEEEEEPDYYSDTLLFLTKAYVLGRQVHDDYFQSEVANVMRGIMWKIMNGLEGFERGMDIFERASKIVRQHPGLPGLPISLL